MGDEGDPPAEHFFKIILIGDSGVGKTSLLSRLVKNEFNEDSLVTKGVEMNFTFITVDNVRIRLTFWDTAGQERFRTMTSNYYRGANGVLIVYDVTEGSSLESVHINWVPELARFAPTNILAMLVGNKTDLVADRVVTTHAGQKFAKEHDVRLFIETSAKDNQNVLPAFTDLVRQLCRKVDVDNNQNNNNNSVDISVGRSPPQSRCYKRRPK
eukprot:TRINITY_DN12284_c0_g1_i1.p1 TRINITY_DN12284_c0_g1~~TRINITY_DN12284_c0_g1_i1.p1  ORF type:complete len:212 (+),score=25.54 TRINITY_DN12284_c0_g1_i1:52-687(+)